MTKVKQIYCCPTCGWVGPEDEMDADSVWADDMEDEMWCNTICPQCQSWHDLEDYGIVS